MKPILVCVHIFYSHMWSELKKCIKNISPFQYELYITAVQQDDELFTSILKDFPQAHIEVVENRGYDVGPFVHILNQVSLDNYSYVIKLHTKRDCHFTKKEGRGFRGLSGPKWRNELLSFLKTPEHFQKVIQSFEIHPDLGITGGYKCVLSHDIYAGQKLIMRLYSFLEKRELPFLKFSFIAGTMFVIRPVILKKIKRLNIKIHNFESPLLKNQDSLAHVYERLFGYFTYFCGYKCHDYTVLEKKQKRFYRKEFIYHYIPYFIHHKEKIKNEVFNCYFLTFRKKEKAN